MTLRVGPMSGFRGGSAPVIPPFRTIIVADQTELNAAIADLEPKDHLRLLPGTYSLVISDVKPTEDVIIESDDEWVEFTEISLTRCEHIHLRYFYFDATGIAFGGTAHNLIYMSYCRDIRVTGVYADGGAAAFYASPALQGHSFMRLENCTRVTVDGEAEPTVNAPGEILNCLWGFRVLASSQITIERYRIEKMQYDSIQISGACNDIIMRRNLVGDQLGSEYGLNHYDAIQLYAHGDNFLIEDNIFAEIHSIAAQGIFITDDNGTGLRNVTVRRNFVHSRAFNGIGFRNIIGGLFEENLVMESINSLDISGGANTPLIQASTSGLPNSGVVVRNNRAPGFTNVPSTGVTGSGNVSSSARESLIPGIDSFTTLAQLEAATMPAGLGPLMMR